MSSQKYLGVLPKTVAEERKEGNCYHTTWRLAGGLEDLVFLPIPVIRILMLWLAQLPGQWPSYRVYLDKFSLSLAVLVSLPVSVPIGASTVVPFVSQAN